MDDTLTESQYGNIQVTDAEIKQATVIIQMKRKDVVEIEFNNNGKALINGSQGAVL